MKEKYFVTRERQAAITPSSWNAVSQTSQKFKKINLINEKFNYKLWHFYNKNRLVCFFKKKDWQKLENIVAQNILNNKSYFYKINGLIKIRTKKANKFIRKIKKINFPKQGTKKIIFWAEKIKKEWLNYDSTIVGAWLMGGDKFKSIIYNLLKIPENDFLFLTTPIKETAVSQLEKKLILYAHSIKNNPDKIIVLAKKLSENYGWVPFDYDGPIYWNIDYFIKKLKKEARKSEQLISKKIIKIKEKIRTNNKKRNELIEKLGLDKKSVKLIDKLNLLAYWTDERKKREFRLHYYYNKILLELAKRYCFPLKNLKYLLTEELKTIEKNKYLLLKKSKQRIRKKTLLEAKNGIIRIVNNNKIESALKKQTSLPTSREARGIIASRGHQNIYQGTAKIILSPSENYKIKSKDFLITTMTTPAYILAMKKAIGFITDEGGVTCHAAIVSREMNKPCIIGTKIATKVFKNGDTIEVNTKKGTIKIIKKL